MYRSEVPDRLLPAYDIAIGDELMENHLLKPENQLAHYKSMGWPVGMPDVRQDGPWPLVPDWSDAVLVLTDKGYATLARYGTKSKVLVERLKVDLDRKTLTLDDVEYDVTSERALRWVRVLSKRPVSGSAART